MIGLTNGRNWNKMPYPKFLENTPMTVKDGENVLWQGKCYYAYRGRAKQAKDGGHDEVNARATTEADLTHLTRRFDEGGLEFIISGRAFVLANFRTAYNPDGSFHHITFGLLERADVDEVC